MLSRNITPTTRSNMPSQHRRASVHHAEVDLFAVVREHRASLRKLDRLPTQEETCSTSFPGESLINFLPRRKLDRLPSQEGSSRRDSARSRTFSRSRIATTPMAIVGAATFASLLGSPNTLERTNMPNSEDPKTSRGQEDELLIVMRSYLEKPRTIVGWKGMINDSDIDK